MTDSDAFAADPGLAYGYCLFLADASNRVRSDATARLDMAEPALPPALGDNATGQWEHGLRRPLPVGTPADP